MMNTRKSTSAYTASELEHIDEDELVNRFQNGDIEAFNPLVLKYQKKIYNLIYQRIRDREIAKDISQEVFLKAFKALPDFKGGSAFYSWIYRIAINSSIDFQRRRNRNRVLTFEELPPDADEVLRMSDAHPSPEKLLEEKELGKIIREAVRKLPPGQRRVFNLRHRRELAIKEIAVLLNRSEGTIKTHLHHAHRRLQSMLLPYLRNEPLEWHSET
ncbi:sigma-70 family RNA polymerase sigma factor [Candidatus Poribacteria bacterium]|nr:sigma-70 family RNA polymerase sigma factor [Candidatus Poribacteria bacterium]MYA58383.1 sigma-70 family RNA polymerase sigma factor [Candidatus Poribacteria bacterium]